MQALAATSLTLNTTTAFLGSVALLQAVAALKGPAFEANALGACVCVVAFLHYTWMRSTDDAAERVRLRYGDWIVTCPLLLWELHATTGVEGQEWALGATALMVLLGYAAVRSVGWKRHALFAVSSLVLAAVVAATLSGAKKNGELVAAFFGVWALYPVAFLFDSNVAFDVLDAVSKGCFGLYVATQM